MATSSRTTDIDLPQVGTDILCEFLEVAFHAILFVRDIYPAGVFRRKKKYNVPIQMCIHPELSKYIIDLITSLKQVIKSGEAQKVALVVLSKDQQPLERFVFELAAPTKRVLGEDTYLLHLEQSLRAFLLKLNTCDALLTTNPPDVTWTVQVHTTDAAVLDMQQTSLINDFSWVESDEDKLLLQQPSLVPLKAVDSPVVKMQLYIEENEHKS